MDNLEAVQQAIHFNPRPPRGGRREYYNTEHHWKIFQSTPSARRATPPSPASRRSSMYFNPRPPRGGRLKYWCMESMPIWISIHALREEGDPPSLSTDVLNYWISIHALREEGDTRPIRRQTPPKKFQSTPSARRATYGTSSSGTKMWNFNPRPPRGGRLLRPESNCLVPLISIHALREEGDGRKYHSQCQVMRFQSTPSARRATCLRTKAGANEGISIHALREEGDQKPMRGGIRL